MYCPSCRGEYREGFSWCKSCDVALVEVLPDEPPAIPETLTDEPEEDLAAGSAEDVALTGSARRLRVLELLLVLFIAFGTSLVLSVFDWWNGISSPPGEAPPTFTEDLFQIFYSVPGLGLLAYVLYRQGRSLRQLGLKIRKSDIPTAVLLTAFTFAPYVLVCVHVHGSYSGPAFQPLASLAAGLKMGPFSLLAVLISAAEEELVARAYLMTEIRALTGKAAVAVLASAGFQTAYHLYQGTSEILPNFFSFLVCSIYYASNRRVMPLILSHVLYNVMTSGFRALN